MTPAINKAKQAKIDYTVHQYQHDPSSESYGEEAAEKLNISKDKVFKTLVVALEGKELAVSVLPVSRMLNLKACATALGAKKVEMANHKDAERATGYVLGGISPLGQKKRLRMVIDESALAFDTILVSAGKRGLDIELSPQDLKLLTKANFAAIAK